MEACGSQLPSEETAEAMCLVLAVSGNLDQYVSSSSAALKSNSKLSLALSAVLSVWALQCWVKKMMQIDNTLKKIKYASKLHRREVRICFPSHSQ